MRAGSQKVPIRWYDTSRPMIDTNLLLTIGFSIVTNFTSIVPVPDQDVPKSPNDLRIYRIGTVRSPTDFFLISSSEANYEIVEGVVSHFASWQDYYAEQDPRHITNWVGVSTLSSNQVIDLVSNTLQRLIPGKIPLTNGPPWIRQASAYREQQVPFFKVRWPLTDRFLRLHGVGPGAEVHVDGRTRKIVYMSLLDSLYGDPKAAEELQAKVYTPDPPRPPVKDPGIQRPTPEQVTRAITNWLVFCKRLGLAPGTCTKIDQVNWEETWTLPDRTLPGDPAMCKIWFTNGVIICAVDGVVYWHVSSQETYAGVPTPEQKPPGYWDALQGTVRRDWKELAKELEPILVEKLGIPEEQLAPYRPNQRFRPTDQGATGIKRLWVDWRIWPIEPEHPGRMVTINETRLGFGAEFDLETGELKGIQFIDPDLILSLMRAETPQKRDNEPRKGRW
jgi:hypothetical protein